MLQMQAGSLVTYCLLDPVLTLPIEEMQVSPGTDEKRRRTDDDLRHLHCVWQQVRIPVWVLEGRFLTAVIDGSFRRSLFWTRYL